MAANPLIKANIGFAATLQIDPISNGNTVFPAALKIRASSVGLNVKQEITYPDLIDGIVDKSVYQLGPKIVEGDIAFPLIHEGAAVFATAQQTSPKAAGQGCGNYITTSIADSWWKLAAERDAMGRLLNSFDAEVIYPDNTRFKYPGCLVNNLGFKVTQGGAVDMTASIIGGANTATNPSQLARISGFNPATDPTPTYLAPARIVTWNDFHIAIYTKGSGAWVQEVDGEGLREFTCDLKNNVERYYTFNGLLVPEDITAKKREISGNIKIMGRSQWLNNFAIGDGTANGQENSDRFTSDEHIAFGYSVGKGNIYWATALHGVIFKAEEMQVSPGELFETTVAYNAAGDCTYDYEAVEDGTNPDIKEFDSDGPPDLGGPTRDTPYMPNVGYSGWTIA